jgi:hypothetical protein
MHSGPDGQSRAVGELWRGRTWLFVRRYSRGIGWPPAISATRRCCTRRWRGWPLSALCSRWLTTWRMGEDALEETLAAGSGNGASAWDAAIPYVRRLQQIVCERGLADDNGVRCLGVLRAVDMRNGICVSASKKHPVERVDQRFDSTILISVATWSRPAPIGTPP